MRASNRSRQCKGNEFGYVALEFALGMGLLVLPTALILLQVPSYLEKHDRVKAIASEVARACANEASNTSEGNLIAYILSIEEINASSSLKSAQLADVRCEYESASLEPGTNVVSSISISVSAPILPGLPVGRDWVINENHSAVIPKYRSFDS